MSKGKTPRIRLSKKEYDFIQNLRFLEKEAIKQGLDPEQVKHGWIKDKKTSLFVTNPLYKNEENKQLDEVRSSILEVVKKESPKKFKEVKNDGNHLLIIDPADVHIGKLCKAMETGDEYNSNIAVNRAKEGIRGVINKAKGFNIEKILFVAGNDILHIDSPKRTTTSGTPQDTDGMWYTNFLKAVEFYKDVLIEISTIAPVHFVYNPSNHDYTNGFFLSQVIEAYFSKHKGITFDISIAHRKYFKYHNSLIGTTHGDGAKWGDLPNLMAYESKELWGSTDHHYFFTHHVHHEITKDMIGCTISSFRSPSGTDSWHHRNGYTGVPKAVEGVLINKDYGQVARITNVF